MRKHWLTAALHAALALATAVVLYPVLWIVKIALTNDPSASLASGDPSLSPTVALLSGRFSRALVVSAIVSLAATLLGLVFATTGAFALSRLRFSGRAVSLRALLLTQMFPSLLMSVPLYLILKWLGLLGTLSGLVIVYSTVSVPFCVWMLKGFFDALPTALDEAAKLDGASELQIFRRVALPLVRPGIAVTGLYAFMGAWNEYILAATFLSRDESYTAPVVLKSLVNDFGAAWGEFAAGSLIVSVPVMLVFFVLERHLVSGLVQGGVKE
ncbi:MAG: carbohydrate ABC transporter permease [Deltaproteobacteria bacterium]|nr:carbohydrate ABC transporter permease [Deltaproteobacteria bacterium]